MGGKFNSIFTSLLTPHASGCTPQYRRGRQAGISRSDESQLQLEAKLATCDAVFLWVLPACSSGCFLGRCKMSQMLLMILIFGDTDFISEVALARHLLSWLHQREAACGARARRLSHALSAGRPPQSAAQNALFLKATRCVQGILLSAEHKRERERERERQRQRQRQRDRERHAQTQIKTRRHAVSTCMNERTCLCLVKTHMYKR